MKAIILATVRHIPVYTHLPPTASPPMPRPCFRCAAVQRVAFTISNTIFNVCSLCHMSSLFDFCLCLPNKSISQLLCNINLHGVHLNHQVLWVPNMWRCPFRLGSELWDKGSSRKLFISAPGWPSQASQLGRAGPYRQPTAPETQDSSRDFHQVPMVFLCFWILSLVYCCQANSK